jgi:signal transduction histidine kinase
MDIIGDEIERISGYPASDFVHSAVRTFASVIHPEDRAMVERDVDAAVARGEPFALEYRIVHRGGEVRWVLERGCLSGDFLDGVIFDVSERKRGEAALRTRDVEAARVAELQASRARIVAAADVARHRLERDLHDGAQQRFVGACLMLQLLERRGTLTGEESALLAQARRELDAGIAELRELAHGLHPAFLVERGLVHALGALAARAPIPVEVRADVDERMAAPIEAALYFTVAEAVTNVAKHADATAAWVRIWRDTGTVAMEVGDDGVGGASVDAGSGLRGLADRLDAVGGSLRVDSPVGEGTRLLASVPA